MDMARWNQTAPMWQVMTGISTLSNVPLSSVTAANWTDFNDIPYILTKTGVVPPMITTPPGGGCSPQNVALSTTPVNGVSYTWEANGVNLGNGGTLNSIFTNEGCYDVTLTASDGNCTVSTTILDLICVEQTPDASFSASPSSLDFSDETVTFSNQSNGAVTYDWDFGNNTSSSAENPIVSYTDVHGNLVVMLVASSLNGCTDTAYQVIHYNDLPIYYVPNSFSPDADEHNPIWKPVFTSGFDPYNFDLYIFNRWGEMIWESHDASVGWDGTYGPNGAKCQDGVYTYVIGFKALDNDKKYKLNGHITLIR
jgi:gliding motility-associated-like protein